MLVGRLGGEPIGEQIAKSDDVVLLKVRDVLVCTDAECTQELGDGVLIGHQRRRAELLLTLILEPPTGKLSHGGSGRFLAAKLMIKFADCFCRFLGAKFSDRHTFESLGNLACVSLIGGPGGFIAPEARDIFERGKPVGTFGFQKEILSKVVYWRRAHPC